MGLPGRWRNGGREGSRESGKILTKPLQQARSSGCSSERGRGQAGEHWVPGRSFLPQSLESRGGWELAQGLGEGQGLSQTLKGQWRGGEGRHATLPMPMPGADITNRGLYWPLPPSPRPNPSSSAQPPTATPDSSGSRHPVIQLPALV